ncbi:MAG: immunoglobulin-like domain-containing protein [Acholeplasmataceae bacterium]
MKKLYLFILMFFVAFSVVACVTTTTTATTTTTTTTTQTSASTTTTEADVTAPIFTGIADAVIYVGDTFDPLTGISALDDIDGLVTSQIIVSGTYDITTPGTYTITYTVSDEAGNETVATRELRVKEAILNTFYIVNGDFSDPLEAPWGQWAGEGGANTTTIVDGVLVYDVTAVGSLTYSNQFSQVDRIVETGKIYQVSFKAKADNVRPLQVQLEDRSNYTLYWNTIANLTTNWVTYTYAFEVTLPTISTGKLGFFAGNVGTTSVPTKIYLDDIVITELTELPGDQTAPVINGLAPYTVEVGIPFDALSGVTVFDDFDKTLSVNEIVISGSVDINTVGVYTLIYTLEDASGNITAISREVTVSTTPQHQYL